MPYLHNRSFMKRAEYKLVYDQHEEHYTLYYEDAPVESGSVEKRQASELVNEYLDPGWTFKRNQQSSTTEYFLFAREESYA